MTESFRTTRTLLAFLVSCAAAISAAGATAAPAPQPMSKPDLAVTALSLDAGCCLRATFKNVGSAPIDMNRVQGDVWVDGVPFGVHLAFATGVLAPGKVLDWQGGAPFRLSGGHKVTMTIDSKNQLAEADESNNTIRDRVLTCRLAAQAHPGAARPVGKPDLVPHIAFHVVQEGDDAGGHYVIFNVVVTARNIGHADAGPFDVLLERHEGLGGPFSLACPTCVIHVAGVAAGAYTQLEPRQFNVRNAQVQSFRATVDWLPGAVHGRIAESNESNNVWTDEYPHQSLHR